jgi:hypothetical protein
MNKRHLLALTKRELLDILLAVQGEAGWLEAHGAPVARRRYKRLERHLEQRLENVEFERRVEKEKSHLSAALSNGETPSTSASADWVDVT